MFKLLRKKIIKLKNGKGFTLTELVVVVALIAIMMASLMAFAEPVRALLKGSTAKSDALTINEILGTFLERRLAYAHRVDVYTGIDYSNSGDLKTKFESLSGYVSEADAKNRPGMIVFHYVEDELDSLKSTYKIYDVQLKKLKEETGELNMPTAAELDEGKYLAFSDDFYGGYEFFMSGEDTGVKINNQKKRAYLNFKIQSFDFRGEYTTTGLTGTDVDAYYKYIDDPTTDDPLYKFINEKTGTENISFALENVKVKTKSVLIDDKGTPTEDDDIYGLQPQMDNGNWVTINRGNGTTTYGKDVIIFYNVRIYDINFWKTHEHS